MSAWLLSLLIAAAPPGRVPERETREAALVRYESIAEDVAAATPDQRTQALLVATLVHESGARLDVDEGITRGDAGRAIGLWQLQNIDPNLTRAQQARIALRRIKQSFAACKDLDERFRLAQYAGGTCLRGHRDSAAMVDWWHRLLGAHQNT